MLSESQRRSMYEQLSPEQRRLVDMGLYSVEDYYDLSNLPTQGNTTVLEDWSARPPAQVATKEYGLLDAITAGRGAADTTAAELERDLVGKGEQGYVLTANPRSPLAMLGALYDVATTDATLGEAYGDRITGNREELAAARREQTRAQEDVARIAEQSKFLRTVADASGSAPESVLPAVGGIAGGLAGTAVKPGGGTVAGGVIGSSLGSIPMARKAFYAAWDEAFQAGKDAGLSEEEASSLADEQALEQASVEFGVEAVFGAIPGLKVGGTVLKRAAANTAGRVALESTSEAATPYAQNLVRAGSAALEGDEREQAVISGMVKDWTGPELLEEAERGFLAGGLTSAAMITPLSGVEARIQLDQEARDAAEAQAKLDRRRSMVDEAKTLIAQDRQRQQQELAEFAQRNASVAQAFQQGTLKQADLFDALVNEELAPSVGGAREIEASQQREQLATEQLDARRVRNTVDDVDRAITEEALARPDSIMAGAFMAANRRGDIANAVRPTVRPTVETPVAAEPEQLGLGFNDTEVARIERLRKQAEAAERRKAQLPTPVQLADTAREKERASFQKDYLTANPSASTEEVLQRTQVWTGARDSLDSMRKSDTSLQAAEAMAAEQLNKLEASRQASLKRKETNTFNQVVRDMAAKGVTDVKVIAKEAHSAISRLREANGITTQATPSAPTPTAPNATAPSPVAASAAPASTPAPVMDEDGQAVAISYEDVLRRLDDSPAVAKDINRVVPEKSAIEVDDDSGDFDVDQIEEPDIRAQAAANPNLRTFLRGTALRPIVYHGTRKSADIRKWKPDAAQMGAHASPAPDGVAAQFARRASDGGKIMRLAVNIKDPIRLMDDGDWSVTSVVPQLAAMRKLTKRQAAAFERQDKALLAERDKLLKGSTLSPEIEASMDAIDQRRNELAAQAVKTAGYDGVLYQNRYEIPGLTDEQVFQRLLDRGIRPVKEEIRKLSDNEFKEIFPETETSVIALDSSQVKNVDENTGEYNPQSPDIKRALPDEQAAKAGKTTVGEIGETYGEDVANLIDDYRNAKGPKQRVQALFDFLELTATGRENAIVRTLLPIMRKFQNYIPDVVIETDSKLVKTSAGVDSLGYFNPNNGKLRFGMDGLTPRTVAHEVLHALTWTRIRDKAAVKADRDLAAAVAQLDEIKATFQQWADKNKGNHKGRLATLLAPRKAGLVDADGKVDVDELITYGLTDPDIQRILRNLPARGTIKSQWRKFVNAVRLAVGLPESSRNMDALESLLDATTLIVGTTAQDSRKEVLGQYSDTMTEDVAEQARQSLVPEQSALPVTTGPIEELSPNSIADALSITVSAQRRQDASIRGERTGTIASIVDAVLPPGSNVEAIRQVLEAKRATETVIDYEIFVTTKQEEVIQKYEEEAKQIIKPGISKEEYAKAEAKIKADNPELFNAITKVREGFRRNALLIIKELYEASPLKDGKRVPNAKVAREINAIAANLDNYWTTAYQVHNKREREQWQQVVRGTPDGQKIIEAATEFLENDLTIFNVADLPTMRRERLERIHAAWVGTKDISSMTKEDLARAIADIISRDVTTHQARAKARVASAISQLLQEKDGANRDGIGNYFSKNRVGRGALKERLEVPKPIADLMGKIDEPLTVLFNTEVTQRMLLNQLQTMRAIRDQYSGSLVFPSREEAEAALGPDADIVELGGPSMGALSGMHVPAEVAQMFAVEQVPNAPNALVAWAQEVLPTYAAAFKFANLVLAPGLWVANMIASPVMAAANGVGPTYFGTLGRSIMSASIGMKNALATGEFDQGARDLLAHGLTDHPIANSMRTKPLEAAVDALRKAGALPEKGYFEEVRDGLSEKYSSAWTMYSGMDVGAKLTTFYHQVDLLEKLNAALPEDLRMTEEQLTQRAAARTRACTFSYELAAQIVKSSDRYGVTIFATYAYETFRSLAASVNRAYSDRQLAKRLEAEGHADAARILNQHVLARSAGITAAAAAFHTYGQAAGWALGVGMAALGYGLSEEEEEKREELEAAYKAANPFDLHKNVRIIGKSEGQFIVADAGRFTDPYGPATELLSGVLSGDTDRAGRALSALVSVNPIIESTFREMLSGTPAPRVIRDDPAAMASWQGQGLAEHNYVTSTLLSVIPGWARSSMVDAAQATGILEDVPMLEAETLVKEPMLATAVFNHLIRVRRYDPMQAITRLDASPLRTRTTEVNDSLRGVAAVSPDLLRSNFLELRALEAEYLDSVVQTVNAARAAGHSEEAIQTQLDLTARDTKLTRGQRMYVLNPKAENYVSSVMSESRLKSLESEELAGATDDKTRIAIMDKYDNIRQQLRALEKEIP